MKPKFRTFHHGGFHFWGVMSERLFIGPVHPDGCHEQFIGVEDSENNNIFKGDICEFDNGDRFIVKCEDHIEFFADWIGEPECEDQSRDLYRLSRSKIIGNIHQNPELLK